jgi:hypothetical protein
MGAVPKQPEKPAGGKYSRIVTALKGLKEGEAIEVATNGKKHLAMFRTEVQKVAKRSTPRRVLSSRDADGKTLWLWLATLPEDKVERVPLPNETADAANLATRFEDHGSG